MSRQRLLERFLKYVRIETTADDHSTSYPSSDGQLKLGKLLASELREMGIADAEQDDYGLIYATLPGNVKDCPVVALNSHLDTSPETPGNNVSPVVIKDYQGGDIPLPNAPNKVIRVADSPELEKLHGCTLITTDGTTLLGGDDKAGIAIIAEVAQRLLENPKLPHGPLKILFTCDEEIGHGVDHVDFARLAADVGYTIDGHGANELNSETFSADMALVRVRGKNIHPAIAKDRMVNAVRVASAFVERMPLQNDSPESTEGRNGFLHPYLISGGVEVTTIRVLLRSFETTELEKQADLLRKFAKETEEQFPGSQIEIEVTPQYRNMREGLKKEPRAVALAIEAHQNLGRPVIQQVIRGGTDGSVLTEKGLPTPNLSSGQHNQHSFLEWACLDEMEQAVDVVLELVKLWSQEKR